MSSLSYITCPALLCHFGRRIALSHMSCSACLSASRGPAILTLLNYHTNFTQLPYYYHTNFTTILTLLKRHTCHAQALQRERESARARERERARVCVCVCVCV